MRSMEFSGRSVDEAIFHGLVEMGVTIDEVEIETLQDESKGLFGFGAKMAVVRLTERETPAVMDLEQIRQQEPREERPARERGGRNNERRERGRGGREREHIGRGRRDEQTGRRSRPVAESYAYSEELAEQMPAAQFLKQILEKMGIHATLAAVETDGGLRIRMETDTDGLLIGRRGETLDALQYLVSLYANHGRQEYQRITLDTEGYRARREETLARLARKEAAQVRSTGRSVTLEPMNPYERRILHSALQDFDGVTTYSEGEEPNRCVIIAPKQDD